MGAWAAALRKVIKSRGLLAHVHGRWQQVSRVGVLNKSILLGKTMNGWQPLDRRWLIDAKRQTVR